MPIYQITDDTQILIPRTTGPEIFDKFLENDTDNFLQEAWLDALTPIDQQMILSALGFFGTSIVKNLENVNDRCKWPQRYGALYAIGSTARLAHQRLSCSPRIEESSGGTTRTYGDIDLLFVTNELTRDIGELITPFPIPVGWRYEWKTFPEEAYKHPERISGQGERSIARITSPIDGASTIHLTIQPEVRSKEYWDQVDTKEKVFIYELNDLLFD